MTRRVAMIGDPVSLTAFGMFGVDTYPLGCLDEAHEVFDRVVRDDFAVVFVTEEVYGKLDREIAQMASRPLPAITVIPSVTSARGVGGEKIETAIERALGTKMPIGNAGDSDEG
jgi:V/A-type H+-transporting ATPase subunit F